MTSTAFQRLKPICVPLLASAALTPSNVPGVLQSLNELHACLLSIINDASTADAPPLGPSLIGYVFFPISTLLRRNPSSAIPDQVLEAVLRVLGILIDQWWWDCELAVWEQIFILCGAIVAGIDTAVSSVGEKATGRVRADETKAAAAQCLLNLLRERSTAEADARGQAPNTPAERLSELQLHCLSTPKFAPLIGQTISSLLATAQTSHIPLQNASLTILRLLIRVYAPDTLIPGVLPGIVSAMTRVALGTGRNSGWARAEAVEGALGVMQEAILSALSDEVCIRDGAICVVETLDDFAPSSQVPSSPSPQQASSGALHDRFTTERSTAWLNGTATQLHIALNTLNPLLAHPTPSAQRAVSNFTYEVLAATTLTLPQSQPLLLSFLLSLAGSDVIGVHQHACKRLVDLLTDDTQSGKKKGAPRRANARHSLMQALMRITRDTLASLPRLIIGKSDAKVAHAASLIAAVCDLALITSAPALSRSVAAGVGTLLGPAGGIEKWGNTLCSVLEFSEPPVSVFATPDPTGDPLLLLGVAPGESSGSTGASAPDVPFPGLEIRSLPSPAALAALARMFRSLGRAAPDDSLFAIEWFTGVGAVSLTRREQTSGNRGRTDTSKAVVALWCACRLLEGASGGVRLLVEGLSSNIDAADRGNAEDILRRPSNTRVEKMARSLAKKMAALWDDPSIFTDGGEASSNPENSARNPPPVDSEAEPLLVEHVKGVVPLHSTLQLLRASLSSSLPENHLLLSLHPAILIHLLTLCLCILFTSPTSSARTQPLLLQTLYPILHVLVAPHPFLSATARAALAHVAHAAAYASVPNMLYANFDYALGGVARRLDARGVAAYGMYEYGEGGAVGAARVLRVLVRLVGGAIVPRAGDVVEACFERLEELHGYDVLVDALVGVLGDVVNVLKADVEAEAGDKLNARQAEELIQGHVQDGAKLLLEWMKHRNDMPMEDDTNYGPAPREAWGPSKKDEQEGDDASNAMPAERGMDPEEPPPTPTQALTSKIITRSAHLLTHPSPVIRARILDLLTSSVPVLLAPSASDPRAESTGSGFHSSTATLLPAINTAWPFVLNRLADPAPFVVAAAAGLVAALATHVGEFMHRRVWDDVWPRFKRILAELDAADSQSALARRRRHPPAGQKGTSGIESTGTGVGTTSAYTHSHRLYRSMLQTLTAALEGGVPPRDSALWEVMLAARRFLSAHAHIELQACARRLYIALAHNNADAVWLVLVGTSKDAQSTDDSREPMKGMETMTFMNDQWNWDIHANMQIILENPVFV